MCLAPADVMWCSRLIVECHYILVTSYIIINWADTGPQHDHYYYLIIIILGNKWYLSTLLSPDQLFCNLWVSCQWCWEVGWVIVFKISEEEYESRCHMVAASPCLMMIIHVARIILNYQNCCCCQLTHVTLSPHLSAFYCPRSSATIFQVFISETIGKVIKWKLKRN